MESNKNSEPVRRIDVSKVVFYGLVSSGLLGLSFFVGLHAGVKKTILFHAVNAVKTVIESSVTTLAEEFPTLTGTHPTNLLQPSRYARDGVTVNDPSSDQGDLILLSGFFKDTNELRLVRRNGDVVARWPVSFYEIFPNPTHLPSAPATDWNTDTHGALALPDGSVLFNFDYAGLVKLDRCGSVVWTVPRETHHSVEPAEGGGFWVPGRRRHWQGRSLFPPFETPFKEDTILKIADDGRVLGEFSVPQIFYDNGLEPILTATGARIKTGMNWDGEILHLNKIDELTSDIAPDFPLFEAGDLALSIRELNLVMVVDKTATKVKWWKIGPWRRQHDPEFKRGGTIVVFNNNAYETDFGTTKNVSPVSAPRVSNVVEINPASGEYRILYGGKEGQELYTVIRGKTDLTPGGGLLITEFEAGRILETNANGQIVWEYVNHYNDEEVGEITEARVYPSSYFNVKEWACSTTP